jgi:hypothetical protein
MGAALTLAARGLLTPAVAHPPATADRNRFKVDTSFLALGTAFPLSFGINVGFQRREKALAALASLKSSCISLYWQHRCAVPLRVDLIYTRAASALVSMLESLPAAAARCRRPLPPRSDWDNASTYPASLGNEGKPNALACETLLFEFLCCIRNYLKHESGFESYAEFVLAARGDSVWKAFFGDSVLTKQSTMKKKVRPADTERW